MATLLIDKRRRQQAKLKELALEHSGNEWHLVPMSGGNQRTLKTKNSKKGHNMAYYCSNKIGHVMKDFHARKKYQSML